MKTESSEFLDTENYCVKTFKENVIFNGGRYEVKLHFRPHTDFIPDNYVVTENTFNIASRTVNKSFEFTF